MNTLNWRSGPPQPRVLLVLAAVVLAAMALAATTVIHPMPGRPARPAARESQPHGPLHTEGGTIVDAHGDDVVLAGVNWFGFETESFSPHGLWARKLDDMLDQIVSSGFNTIRLPYSNQLLDPASKPNGIDYGLNPDLVGLSGSSLLDRFVDGATRRGLMVILDRHRPSAQGQSELWYTDHVSEQTWISDWVTLATRYRDNPLVIGADLHNEPHGPATWGDGNERTDWRLASGRAGNAVLAANPNWLIFVEGVASHDSEYYWWGGNLQATRDKPVQLTNKSKLVYSAHDYGPGVWRQSWFDDATFPNNLPALWQRNWAYLAQEGTAPVLLGEFGGRSVGNDAEGIWQRTLVRFLKDNGISYTYWAWNPNSGDTGGILRDDWQTVDDQKLAALSEYQRPIRAPKS